MIEAYRIGVNLALSGTIAGDLGKVASQFDALNQVIRRSQMAVNELASGMRALSRVGQSAADAWTRAAGAMERAARATRQSASGGFSGPQPGGGGGMSRDMAVVAAALASNRSTALVPYHGGAGPVYGPQGGGSYPRVANAPRGLATSNGNPFAGGPGSGSSSTALMAAGGGGRGGGGIPLNYNAGPSYPSMPNHDDFATAAVGFGAAGYGLLSFTKAVTEAGIEAGHLQAQLRALGFTQEQSAEARTLAMAEQRRTPGITTTGTLEIIRDLAAVTQNAAEALNPNVIQGFARAGVVLGAAGKGDAIGELFKSMQAGELRGMLKADEHGEINTATLMGFLRNVITTTLVTGGRVGPREQLQFLKSSGLGGAMMSDRTQFADAIAPILSMGAASAGTGLRSFSQQFVAGKMSEAGARLLEQMGLIDLSSAPQQFKMVGRGKNRHQEEVARLDQFKVGMGSYHIPPQYLVGGENAAGHPAEYILKSLLPKIDAYMAASEGKPADEAALLRQRMTAASMISSRVPAGNFIGDIIRNYALIERDRQAIAKGGDRDAFANAQTDPRVKMQALSAAMGGLLTALSGPIMDTAIGVLTNLTSGLNALSAWAEKNPGIAGRIVETATALGTLAAAIAGISAVLFVAGPMLRVAKWGMETAGVAGSRGAAVAAATGGGLLSRLAGRVLGPLGLGMAAFDAAKMTGGIFGDINDTIHGRMPGSLASRAGAAPGGSAPSGGTVQLHGDINMDGKKVGEIVAKEVSRNMAGPRAGATGPDITVNPYMVPSGI